MGIYLRLIFLFRSAIAVIPAEEKLQSLNPGWHAALLAARLED